MFEDLVESYYLDSQIRDNFQCNQNCYTHYSELMNDNHPSICTHNYQYIAQNIDDLSDSTQQNNIYFSEDSASSFTDDADMNCEYIISDHTLDIQDANNTHTKLASKYTAKHSQ